MVVTAKRTVPTQDIAMLGRLTTARGVRPAMLCCRGEFGNTFIRLRVCVCILYTLCIELGIYLIRTALWTLLNLAVMVIFTIVLLLICGLRVFVSAHVSTV